MNTKYSKYVINCSREVNYAKKKCFGQKRGAVCVFHRIR